MGSSSSSRVALLIKISRRANLESPTMRSRLKRCQVECKTGSSTHNCRLQIEQFAPSKPAKCRVRIAADAYVSELAMHPGVMSWPTDELANQLLLLLLN